MAPLKPGFILQFGFGPLHVCEDGEKDEKAIATEKLINPVTWWQVSTCLFWSIVTLPVVCKMNTSSLSEMCVVQLHFGGKPGSSVFS